MQFATEFIDYAIIIIELYYLSLWNQYYMKSHVEYGNYSEILLN